MWKFLFTIWWCCAPPWHLNGMLQPETKTIRHSDPHHTMLMMFRSLTSKRYIAIRNENHRLAPLPNTMLTIMAEECKHTCWEALRLLISLPCLHPCLLSQNPSSGLAPSPLCNVVSCSMLPDRRWRSNFGLRGGGDVSPTSLVWAYYSDVNCPNFKFFYWGWLNDRYT